MKNNKLLIIALSLILCMTVSIGLAVAYFTDYEAAKGGAVLQLTGQTEIEEEIKENEKIVKINNTGETDMVVRILVFSNEKFTTVNDDGTNWIKGSDGNYYYGKVLKAGQSTTELTITVKGRSTPKDPIDYDITVVHESERVLYDGNKVAIPEGWAVSSIAAE